METNSNKVQVELTADLSALSSQDLEALKALEGAMRATDTLYAHQIRDGFYPKNLTKEAFTSVVDSHRIAAWLNSPFSRILENGEMLTPIHYSLQYKEQLKTIADSLKAAAEKVSNASLAAFLKKRADEFVTRMLDDNWITEGDKLWLEVGQDSPFELTIGPYEDYDDDLMGIKTSFEAILGIVLPEEAPKLKLWTNYAHYYDVRLAEIYGSTPASVNRKMVVMDQIDAAGFSKKFTATAYVLPNDPDFRKKFGSKQVFIRNVLRGRVRHMLLPIQKTLAPEFSVADPDELYLRFVVAHETAHSFGIRMDTRLQESANRLEECKADVMGLAMLYSLEEAGEKVEAEATASLHIFDCLRCIRRDHTEAHGMSTLIQYNYIFERGGFEVLDNSQIVLYAHKIKVAILELQEELIKIAMNGDYRAAQLLIKRYGNIGPVLQKQIEALKDIPTDLDPVFPQTYLGSI